MDDENALKTYQILAAVVVSIVITATIAASEFSAFYHNCETRFGKAVCDAIFERGEK